MIETLRRLYNSVDALLDRRALHSEIRLARDLPDSRLLTAQRAFGLVLPLAQGFERHPHLTLINGHQLDYEGVSSRWEFFFDLPSRRARLVCGWSLTWDSSADNFGSSRLELTARPFPPPGSVYRTMIQEGKLLRRQLIGIWHQEQRRTPHLPLSFRDSDEVIAELTRQGLDPTAAEFSFGTGSWPDGRPAWIARARDNRVYYADFE